MRDLWCGNIDILIPRPLEIPAGSYAGMEYRITGTNNALQTATLADLGDTRIDQQGGSVIHSAPFDLLGARAAMQFGLLEAASAAGGAYRFIVRDMFRNPLNQLDRNVMTRPMIVQFAGADPVVIAAGVVEVYALRSAEKARYLHNLVYQEQENTTNRWDLKYPNVLGVTWAGPATDPVMVYFKRDGRVETQGSWQKLESDTDMDTMTEVATNNAIQVRFDDSSYLEDKVGGSVSVELIMPAAPPAENFRYLVEFASEFIGAAEREAAFRIALPRGNIAGPGRVTMAPIQPGIVPIPRGAIGEREAID